MNLIQYEGKNVRVCTKDGMVYSEIVDLYTSANDNDVNEPAIAISTEYIWLDESEIKSIEVIEDE
ncbi:MAG: hypothetical protein LUD57_05685 [Ruminococcus sp.]|nr:hypothetical protein [Ruminococcus sp.]